MTRAQHFAQYITLPIRVQHQMIEDARAEPDFRRKVQRFFEMGCEDLDIAYEVLSSDEQRQYLKVCLTVAKNFDDKREPDDVGAEFLAPTVARILTILT